MSKPKPGSLRDRIAAFEGNTSPTNTTATGAPPRPKPGAVSWKPKQPSPPQSPQPGSDDHGRPATGMSVSDARDSIGKAGSIRERMAALQGKGAFGAPTSPPITPKSDRPKWRPPPPIVSPTDEASKQPLESGKLHTASPGTLSPSAARGVIATDINTGPPDHVTSPSTHVTAVPENEEENEEERQRRAALAARMARIGGARVGMAPPVFGRKQSVPRPEVTAEDVPLVSPTREENPPTDKEAVVVSSPLPSRASSQDQPQSEDNAPLARKNSESASLHSLDSVSPPSRTPPAMPVPSVPRRAAPPRKKISKTASLTPDDEASTTLPQEQPRSPVLSAEPSREEPVKEVPDSVKDTQVQPTDAEIETTVSGTKEVEVNVANEQPASPVDLAHSIAIEATPAPPLTSETIPEEEVQETNVDPVLPRDFTESHPQAQAEHHEEEIEDEEGDAAGEHVVAPENDEDAKSEEEDEAARRRRVAERLAKMGAFNPFAPPPRRQSSGVSVEDATNNVMELGSEVPSSLPVSLEQDEQAAVAESIQSGVHDTMIPEEDEGDDLPDESGVGAQGGELEEEQDEQRDVRALASKLSEHHEVGESDDEQDDRRGNANVEDVPENILEYQDDEASGLAYTTEGELPGDVEEDTSLNNGFGAAQADEEQDYDYGNNDEEDDQLQEVLPHSPPAISFVPTPTPILNIPPPPPRIDSHPLIAPPTRPPPPPRMEQSTSGGFMQVPPPPIRFVPPPPPPLLPQEGQPAGREGGHPIPPGRSVPPPPSQSSAEEEAHLSEEPKYTLPPVPARFVPPPPRPLKPVMITDEHENEHGQSEHDLYQEEEPEEENVEPIPISLPTRPPPRPPTAQVPSSQVQEKEEEEVVLPTLPPPIPRRVILSPPLPYGPQDEESQGVGAKILTTPPPVPPPIRRRSLQPPSRAPPVPSQGMLSAVPTSADDGSLPGNLRRTEQQEVLDESEGDPIDPTFHSPSRRASIIMIPSPESSAASLQPGPGTGHTAARSAVTSEDVSEKAAEEPRTSHPRTIAERMAKLGGIKFGAPIPVGAPKVLPSQQEDDGVVGGPEVGEGKTEQDVSEEQQEEDEQARKQRIAARMAGLGGMRLGMMPFGVGLGTSRGRREASGDSESEVTSPSRPGPPPRLFPPPPPPVSFMTTAGQDADSEQESMPTSEEGVKVEAEEDSEMEEVEYEDALEQEEEGELIPPPIPSRIGRPPAREDVSTKRVSHPPPIPGGRPPVPVLPPIRRTSVSATEATARKVSGEAEYAQQGISSREPASYVMVDEPGAFESEEVSSLSQPQPRPTSRVMRPGRAAPPPPAGPVEVSDSPGSQWEIPSIPASSLDFGEDPEDLSMSVWSELSQSGTFNAPLSPTKRGSMSTVQGQAMQAKRASMMTMGEVPPKSADELMAVWGRVGVQVCEAATTLFDQSKRSLIGDGTYLGFVNAVMGLVPNAVMPAPSVYGYVVYAQSGTTVQKRASEIMPGDVVLLLDAKFKGHKGLQTYNQTVGTGGPVVGIVSEFEVKKSKIRAFQANQHVGQQTVESVSYRLEDLKSGTVKVFRVLDAIA